jgi:2-polyprenyl-3-methyl-5-hydroxy-6-metoxy-1,4-benzoquinol methylase
MFGRLRRAIRPVQNPMLPAITLDHLRDLRLEELKSAFGLVQSRGRLLEVGAGRGWQAAALATAGFDVEAIDLAPSPATGPAAWPVKHYDGRRIPFENARFDVVFSSNTLEHILDRDGFQAEIRRVLKDDGLAIHIVPSAAWRLWTNLAFPLRYFFVPLRHGEHASNAWTEIGEFREAAWRRVFIANNWDVVHSAPTGLFYTGCSLADARLPVERRRALSRFMGSACHVFVLKKLRPTIDNVSGRPTGMDGERRR